MHTTCVHHFFSFHSFLSGRSTGCVNGQNEMKRSGTEMSRRQAERHARQALEPHISEQIMKLHHTKHHQGYVNGLNAAEKAYAESTSTRDKISLQSALKFNGGGESLFHTMADNNNKK